MGSRSEEQKQQVRRGDTGELGGSWAPGVGVGVGVCVCVCVGGQIMRRMGVS